MSKLGSEQMFQILVAEIVEKKQRHLSTVILFFF